MITKGGILIDNIFDKDQSLKIDNINDYLETHEIISIIIIKNEFVNNITLTNKNPLLSSYNCKKKIASNLKVGLKIIFCIFVFFFLIYLLVFTFGKEEDF